MARLHRVVIGSFSIIMAATAATAQPSGSTATETSVKICERDLNGVLRVSEMQVTRTTESKDGEKVVTETYKPMLYPDRLALSQRVRRVTTVTSEGRETVEEIEEPPRGSPHEPARVVRRSVTTMRRSGPDAYVTEQRVFDRDLNGRFVPVQTQTERRSRP